jgi:hypothetical protein
MSTARRAIQYLAAAVPVDLGANNERDQIYVFTPAAVASVCTINEGGAAGVAVLTLAAPANGPSVVVGPIRIRNPHLAACTAGASLSVLE